MHIFTNQFICVSNFVSRISVFMYICVSILCIMYYVYNMYSVHQPGSFSLLLFVCMLQLEERLRERACLTPPKSVFVCVFVCVGVA